MKTHQAKLTPRKQIKVWWHGIAALPSNRRDQTYHALRRVWGDHTIAGSRGFYQIGSEDNITLALFQNWALFPDARWVTKLVAAVGGSTGTIKKAQWAYACEEILDAKLQAFHSRNFIIPDIMLIYEAENGLGLIGFEVKKPGKAIEVPDGRKLTSYIDLPSTRKIARRHGCFLVSQQMAERSRRACDGAWPILSWEQLGKLQIEAALNLPLPSSLTEQVVSWIGWHFMHYGIDVREPVSAPGSAGIKCGTTESYEEIDRYPLPESIRRFLKGSVCVLAVSRGEHVEPVLPWLVDEPTVDVIRQRKWQTTDDRRICRWSFDWNLSRERNWR